MSSPVLAVEALEAGYEPGAAIIRGISLTVDSGEIVSILGPNGAGKSTLIKAVAGLVPKFRGKVILEGRDITAIKAHELARSGLAYVPQTDNVFALMSVDDNLRLASDILTKPERQGQIEAMYGIFPDLARQRRLESGRLSGGQRQMLAIARALIAKPHILVLDEASAGLSPKLSGKLFAKLAEVRDGGVTIIMVEQNARAALAACDRAIILSDGRIAHQGPAAHIGADPSIGRLFFGMKSPEAAV
jgi:branched-chain amino acid transport system ATP-binding protein